MICVQNQVPGRLHEPGGVAAVRLCHMHGAADLHVQHVAGSAVQLGSHSRLHSLVHTATLLSEVLY